MELITHFPKPSFIFHSRRRLHTSVFPVLVEEKLCRNSCPLNPKASVEYFAGGATEIGWFFCTLEIIFYPLTLKDLFW